MQAAQIEQQDVRKRWIDVHRAKGCLTASQFGCAVGLKGTVHDYVDYLRRIVGTDDEFRGNGATFHGQRTESVSKAVYELLRGVVVDDGGFFPSLEDPHHLACSPDGVVIWREDGGGGGSSSNGAFSHDPTSPQRRRPLRLLEIKSPVASLYDAARAEQTPHGIPKAYMCQVQGQLFLADADDCDFFVFVARWPPELCLWRVRRCDAFWRWLRPKLLQVCEWLRAPPDVPTHELVARDFRFGEFDWAAIPVEPIVAPTRIVDSAPIIDRGRFSFFLRPAAPGAAGGALVPVVPTPTIALSDPLLQLLCAGGLRERDWVLWLPGPDAALERDVDAPRRGGGSESPARSQPAGPRPTPQLAPPAECFCCGGRAAALPPLTYLARIVRISTRARCIVAEVHRRVPKPNIARAESDDAAAAAAAAAPLDVSELLPISQPQHDAPPHEAPRSLDAACGCCGGAADDWRLCTPRVTRAPARRVRDDDAAESPGDDGAVQVNAGPAPSATVTPPRNAARHRDGDAAMPQAPTQRIVIWPEHDGVTVARRRCRPVRDERVMWRSLARGATANAAAEEPGGVNGDAGAAGGGGSSSGMPWCFSPRAAQLMFQLWHDPVAVLLRSERCARRECVMHALEELHGAIGGELLVVPPRAAAALWHVASTLPGAAPAASQSDSSDAGGGGAAADATRRSTFADSFQLGAICGRVLLGAVRAAGSVRSHALVGRVCAVMTLTVFKRVLRSSLAVSSRSASPLLPPPTTRTLERILPLSAAPQGGAAGAAGAVPAADSFFDDGNYSDLLSPLGQAPTDPSASDDRSAWAARVWIVCNDVDASGELPDVYEMALAARRHGRAVPWVWFVPAPQ
jgi:hypothetical protein